MALVHAWVVYRREVMQTPLRALAAEIGISKSAVDKFHKRKSSPGKAWPRLKDWYMAAKQKRAEEYQTPPELLVESTMYAVNGHPQSMRLEALRTPVEAWDGMYVRRRMPVPDWVQVVADLAKRESAALRDDGAGS